MTDMSVLGAASGTAFTPTASGASEADALMQSATARGSLDTHTLASEIAHLTPDQQHAVMPQINARLSPLQQGQVQHALAGLAQAPKGEPLPPEMQGIYQRDAQGHLQLTPAYAHEACENYNKIMDSNQKVGDVVTFGTGGATVAALGSHALDHAMGAAGGKALGVVGAIAGMTTAALAHAPAPPGCVKK